VKLGDALAASLQRKKTPQGIATGEYTMVRLYSRTNALERTQQGQVDIRPTRAKGYNRAG